MRPLHDLNPVRLEYVERAGALAGLRRARRRLRRRTAGRSDGPPGRARDGPRPRVRAAAGRASCTRSRPASRSTTGSSPPSSTPRATPAPTTSSTCMEMLEHVPDPASVVAALAAPGAPGRPRLRLDDQPHAARLPARGRRRRVRAAPAAARHAHLREVHPSVGTRGLGARPPGSRRWTSPGSTTIRSRAARASSTDARVNYLMHLAQAGPPRRRA